MRNLFSAKRGERFAREPVDGPLGVGPGSQPLIESDRLTVPVEHRPLEPATPALDRQAGQLLEQRTPDAVAATLRNHEQVLEVDTGLRQKRREIVKEQGKPDRFVTI